MRRLALPHCHTIVITIVILPGSKLRNNVEWVKHNFPQQIRFNQVIFKSDNVLSPEVIQEMFNLTMRMREVGKESVKRE